MTTTIPEVFPHLDYKPKLPRNLNRGIAIIGAGGIINYAHLPAYKKAGFRVVGITDRNREAAETTAKESRDSAQVYASIDELLVRTDVEIVDVAIYPAGQLEIVEKVTRRKTPRSLPEAFRR